MSREKQKGERELIIGDQRWGFKISGGGVQIMEPSRAKHFVRMTEFTGLNWNQLEDSKIPLKPSHVRAYIEANLLAKAA